MTHASVSLAEERGACPDAAEYGIKERFSNKTAIAPTASISIICGGTSAGVEPISGNSYTHKTLSGSFNVRNKYLKKVLEKYKKNDEEIWSSITTNQGSVSHLDFLTKEEKDTFKTAFEIDQRWVIELGADRTPHISQAQSINVFVPADIHKKELHAIHFQAWKKGLKSLYYCRSKSIQRAENVTAGSSTDVTKNVYTKKAINLITKKTIMRSVYHVSSRKIKSEIIQPKKMGLLVENPVYKPFRYPWCYDAWLTQQRIHWLPEEVPLGDDVRDWQKNITPAEKNLLTHIFRFFTQADVEVNNCYLRHYTTVFKPTEVLMMMTAFAAMETVHIAAYSHIC